MPLQSLGLKQLRNVYWDYNLDDTYCPRAKGALTKSDLLAVLVPLELLGGAERANRIVALQAREVAAAATKVSKVSKSKGGRAGQKFRMKKKEAAAAQPGAKTGRWTDSEHGAFLQGLGSRLECPASHCRELMQLVPSRSENQIHSHAQKYLKAQAKIHSRKRSLSDAEIA
jgi:hypothetical protein